MPRRRNDLPTFEQVRNELNNASFRDDGARAANQGQLTTHFGRAFTERFARDPFAEDRELDQANATQANRYLVERINIGNYNGAINRLAGDDVGRKYGALVRYGTQLEIEAARKRDQIRQQLLNDEIPGVSNLYEGIDDDLLDKLTNNIYVIRYRDEALHLDAYHRAKESFVAQMPVSNHTYKTTVMNDGNPEETIVTRPFTTYLADIEEKTVDQVYSLPANEDIAEKRQFISGGQRYQPDTTAAPAFGYVINRNPLADNPFTAVPAEHRALAQAVGTPNASETMASQKNRYIHQLAQCEYYKQNASDIAARAGEMLAELDSIEKPEDHTNNPSYNAFRESLRRLRDSCNEGVDPQKMIDNMILVNRFAKHYEDSHTGLFSFSAYNDYGKKRLALSQRAQTFAAVNIAKLNPQYYGLSRKPIDHQIQRYRNDIERIDRTAAKLNIQGIPNSYSFRSHDLSRMGEMNRRLHNAQRGVWNGSPQYDTYAQEMVGLTSNYIMCRNTLDDPNASAQNKREAIESIRDSIQRVRTAGNAYIQRKNEQGLIQNGACGSVKTQKRVTTVLDGMRFLDVLNEHLDDELMAIDSPDAANIRFNDRINANVAQQDHPAEDAVPQAVEPQVQVQVGVQLDNASQDLRENNVIEDDGDIQIIGVVEEEEEIMDVNFFAQPVDDTAAYVRDLNNRTYHSENNFDRLAAQDAKDAYNGLNTGVMMSNLPEDDVIYTDLASMVIAEQIKTGDIELPQGLSVEEARLQLNERTNALANDPEFREFAKSGKDFTRDRIRSFCDGLPRNYQDYKNFKAQRAQLNQEQLGAENEQPVIQGEQLANQPQQLVNQPQQPIVQGEQPANQPEQPEIEVIQPIINVEQIYRRSDKAVDFRRNLNAAVARDQGEMNELASQGALQAIDKIENEARYGMDPLTHDTSVAQLIYHATLAQRQDVPECSGDLYNDGNLYIGELAKVKAEPHFKAFADSIDQLKAAEYAADPEKLGADYQQFVLDKNAEIQQLENPQENLVNQPENQPQPENQNQPENQPENQQGQEPPKEENDANVNEQPNEQPKEQPNEQPVMDVPDTPYMRDIHYIANNDTGMRWLAAAGVESAAVQFRKMAAEDAIDDQSLYNSVAQVLFFEAYDNLEGIPQGIISIHEEDLAKYGDQVEKHILNQPAYEPFLETVDINKVKQYAQDPAQVAKDYDAFQKQYNAEHNIEDGGIDFTKKPQQLPQLGIQNKEEPGSRERPDNIVYVKDTYGTTRAVFNYGVVDENKALAKDDVPGTLGAVATAESNQALYDINIYINSMPDENEDYQMRTVERVMLDNCICHVVQNILVHQDPQMAAMPNENMHSISNATGVNSSSDVFDQLSKEKFKSKADVYAFLNNPYPFTNELQKALHPQLEEEQPKVEEEQPKLEEEQPKVEQPVVQPVAAVPGLPAYQPIAKTIQNEGQPGANEPPRNRTRIEGPRGLVFIREYGFIPEMRELAKNDIPRTMGSHASTKAEDSVYVLNQIAAGARGRALQPNEKEAFKNAAAVIMADIEIHNNPARAARVDESNTAYNYDVDRFKRNEAFINTCDQVNSPEDIYSFLNNPYALRKQFMINAGKIAPDAPQVQQPVVQQEAPLVGPEGLTEDQLIAQLEANFRKINEIDEQIRRDREDYLGGNLEIIDEPGPNRINEEPENLNRINEEPKADNRSLRQILDGYIDSDMPGSTRQSHTIVADGGFKSVNKLIHGKADNDVINARDDVYRINMAKASFFRAAEIHSENAPLQQAENQNTVAQDLVKSMEQEVKSPQYGEIYKDSYTVGEIKAFMAAPGKELDKRTELKSAQPKAEAPKSVYDMIAQHKALDKPGTAGESYTETLKSFVEGLEKLIKDKPDDAKIEGEKNLAMVNVAKASVFRSAEIHEEFNGYKKDEPSKHEEQNGKSVNMTIKDLGTRMVQETKEDKYSKIYRKNYTVGDVKRFLKDPNAEIEAMYHLKGIDKKKSDYEWAKEDPQGYKEAKDREAYERINKMNEQPSLDGSAAFNDPNYQALMKKSLDELEAKRNGNKAGKVSENDTSTKGYINKYSAANKVPNSKRFFINEMASEADITLNNLTVGKQDNEPLTEEEVYQFNVCKAVFIKNLEINKPVNAREGNEPIGADADNFRDEMLKSCDNMAKNSKVSAVFKKEYTAKDVKDFRANIKPDMDKYNEKKRLDKDLDKPKKSGMKK